MLKQKREMPSILQSFETRIEDWRAKLLSSLHSRNDVAVYLLVTAACEEIANRAQQLLASNPAQLEHLVRSRLFALGFGLRGIKKNLQTGKFVEGLINGSLSTAERTFASGIISQLDNYSLVSDLYQTYSWGGYEIETFSENSIRFVDNPAWTDERDNAQRDISQEIDIELARNLETQVTGGLHYDLARLKYTIPPSLPLKGLTAEQFTLCRNSILESIFTKADMRSCLLPVVEDRDSIVANLKRRTSLSDSEAKRFVVLSTFDSELTGALSLFHCPLVQLTETSLITVPTAYMTGDLVACIPRLAVKRGLGLNRFSKDIERYLLNGIGQHYAAEGVTINPEIPYSWEEDSGDIDLVVYESNSNRLLIGMVKAFIPPDTVEEVIRANTEIIHALDQIARVRRWLENLPEASWMTALRAPLTKTRPNIDFAVIGNGFVGSSYIAVPTDVSVVDARYLLLSRFRGRSIFDAIVEYEQNLAKKTASAAACGSSHNSLSIAGITFEFPSRIVSA